MDEELTVESSGQPKMASVDVVSLVAALIFAAAGAIVLAGESLADIDPVVLAGVALIAIGVARFVAVPIRSRARRRALEVEPSKEAEPQEEQGQDQDQTTES